MPTRDEEFLGLVRELPCLGCGAHGPSDAHHVKTRGSGGGDDPWNLIPLCRACHNGWHYGPERFLEFHPWIREHLELLGWEFENGKRFPPKNKELEKTAEAL